MDTINTSFGKPNMMWGRVVANHTFIKAIAEMEQCERLTLFVPAKSDARILQQTLLTTINKNVAVVAFLSIAEYLKEHPIDVLHTLDPEMANAAHIRNFLADSPFVITGMTHSLANQHFLSWAICSSANGIGEKDCLVCTTQTAKSVVDTALDNLVESQPGFSRPSTTVIPLGVSLPPSGGDRKQLREQLGLAQDEFIVLSLGRFDPVSKMDFLPLLNLITLVESDDKRPIRFVLAGAAGDGNYLDTVRQWIDKLAIGGRTTLLLNLEEQQKSDLYHAADVFLSMSDNLQETFGLTVVEAMTAGLPVIASDWNGYKTLVDHGATGYLIPTRMLSPDLEFEAAMSLQIDSQMHLFCAQTTAVDLVAAARYVQALYEDPELTKSMGEAAASSAQQYRWSDIAQRYLQLWQSLKESAGSREKDSSDNSLRTSFFRVIEDFSSYPTAHLQPADRFVTSSIGRLVLEKKRVLYLYGQLAELMDLNVLSQLINKCVEPRSLQQLQQDYPQISPMTLRHNLMWLYKYGYLETAD